MHDETSQTRTIIKPKRRINYSDVAWRVAKQGFVYLFIFVLSYGFFQFANRHLLQTVQVDGASMSPTMPNAKCYLLNRVVYMIREPKTSEIVVLKDPETEGFAVKRVIARPGDAVFMEKGRVFVNGQLLNEKYLENGTKTFTMGCYDAQLWVCGQNQYFVLGDNRDNSADSRIYGVVPRQNILGMVTP
jgi:signal peptidase I